MKKVAYKCSFISVTTDQWPLVATESIPPPTSRALYKARSTSTFASTWRMCVAGKNLNSNQFVEVLSHFSFVIATCSHLCIRDFIGKYVRGGRATIPATATSKRFNRQWRRLPNGHIWLNYLKRPFYASKVFGWIKTWQNTISQSANQQQPQQGSESGLLEQIGVIRVFFLKQMTWVLWHIFVLYQGGCWRQLDNSSHFLVPLIYYQLTRINNWLRNLEKKTIYTTRFHN